MELIGVKREGGVAVVAPTVKRLDASVAPAFKQAVVDALQAGGDKRLLVDLSGVDFLDSSGLGSLVSILKALGAQGTMGVCGAKGAVLSLFKLTRMDKVFPLYEDQQQGLAQLG